MSDLISRQAAIEALVKAIREDPYYDSDGAGLSVCDVRVILNELPSAQQWIPVSERLPEAEKDVLISYHYESECEFFPSYDGVKISYWVGTINHNKPDFDDMGYATEVKAWMPLPEPYKGE